MAKAEHKEVFPVSGEAYYKAVVDYSSYPSFVVGCKSVDVKRNSATEVQVKYSVSLMKDLWYLLRHTENPDTLGMQWELVESDLLKGNTGFWKITNLPKGGCEVIYSIDIEFKIPVPGFILSSLVKGTLPAMLKGFAKKAAANG